MKVVVSQFKKKKGALRSPSIERSIKGLIDEDKLLREEKWDFQVSLLKKKREPSFSQKSFFLSQGEGKEEERKSLAPVTLSVASRFDEKKGKTSFP